jgi:hypothetical protein
MNICVPFNEILSDTNGKKIRSVEIYRGKNLHPAPELPLTDGDRNWHENGTDRERYLSNHPSQTSLIILN